MVEEGKEVGHAKEGTFLQTFGGEIVSNFFQPSSIPSLAGARPLLLISLFVSSRDPFRSRSNSTR